MIQDSKEITFETFRNKWLGIEAHPHDTDHQHIHIVANRIGFKEMRHYHIDYCFASLDLLDKLKEVEIGAYAKWSSHSDHTPLIVSSTYDGKKKALTLRSVRIATGSNENDKAYKIIKQRSYSW